MSDQLSAFLKSKIQASRSHKNVLEDNKTHLRKIIELLLNQEEGIMFLRYLYFASGASGGTLQYATDGSLDVQKTIVASARKDFYDSEIRRHISSKHLQQIERQPWEGVDN